MKKSGDTLYWLVGTLLITGALISLVVVYLEKQNFGSRSYCTERALADLWGIQIFRSPLQSDYWCEVPETLKTAEFISWVALAIGAIFLASAIFVARKNSAKDLSRTDIANIPTVNHANQSSNFAQKLRELESLRKEGILTDEEFQIQKKRFLDS